MLEMLRSAQAAAGTSVALTVDAKSRRIVGVETGDSGCHDDTEQQARRWSRFVESMALGPTIAPMGNLAIVEFTTAPPFSGAGNVLGLVPFKPALRSFLVVQGSLEYELFLAGLRDKLRMRVPDRRPGGGATRPGRRHSEHGGGDMNRLESGARPTGTTAAAAATAATTGERPRPRGTSPPMTLGARGAAPHGLGEREPAGVDPDLAPVARRRTGGDRCTEGLPSSDLSPQGLRDLHIPYTAEWTGHGCFNPGVYRLQFGLDVEFEVQIDCKPLCLHASADGTVRFAHACLHGDHEVRVVLKGWTCKKTFEMDVYRIR